MYHFFFLIFTLNVGATSAGGLPWIIASAPLLPLFLRFVRTEAFWRTTTLPLRFFALVRRFFGFPIFVFFVVPCKMFAPILIAKDSN